VIESNGDYFTPPKEVLKPISGSMIELRPPNAPVSQEEFYIPNYLANAVTDVNFETLRDNGINTVLLDVDNTLVKVGGEEINPELLDYLKNTKQKGVIKHLYLASRARGMSSRIQSVAEQVGAKVILSTVIKRKPSPRWFSEALKFVRETTEEDLVGPSQMSIIGDRIIHDIKGANKAGLTTVLVNPIGDFVPTDNLSLIPQRERRQQSRLEFYLNRRQIVHPQLKYLT